MADHHLVIASVNSCEMSTGLPQARLEKYSHRLKRHCGRQAAINPYTYDMASRLSTQTRGKKLRSEEIPLDTPAAGGCRLGLLWRPEANFAIANRFL
jgi:hypothetical protein